MRILWICIAGAVGTGARYLLGDWILRLTGPSFPWSTLVINGPPPEVIGRSFRYEMELRVASADRDILAGDSFVGASLGGDQPISIKSLDGKVSIGIGPGPLTVF